MPAWAESMVYITIEYYTQIKFKKLLNFKLLSKIN